MQIRRTQVFRDWLADLRDRQARFRILDRIDRLENGNPGQSRTIGDGIVELKIDYGPGYRVYYMSRGNTLIVLLCGGDKGTQEKDIRRAKELAGHLSLEDLL